MAYTDDFRNNLVNLMHESKLALPDSSEEDQMKWCLNHSKRFVTDELQDELASVYGTSFSISQFTKDTWNKTFQDCTSLIDTPMAQVERSVETSTNVQVNNDTHRILDTHTSNVETIVDECNEPKHVMLTDTETTEEDDHTREKIDPHVAVMDPEELDAQEPKKRGRKPKTTKPIK